MKNIQIEFSKEITSYNRLNRFISFIKLTNNLLNEKAFFDDFNNVLKLINTYSYFFQGLRNLHPFYLLNFFKGDKEKQLQVLDLFKNNYVIKELQDIIKNLIIPNYFISNLASYVFLLLYSGETKENIKKMIVEMDSQKKNEIKFEEVIIEFNVKLKIDIKYKNPEKHIQKMFYLLNKEQFENGKIILKINDVQVFPVQSKLINDNYEFIAENRSGLKIVKTNNINELNESLMIYLIDNNMFFNHVYFEKHLNKLIERIKRKYTSVFGILNCKQLYLEKYYFLYFLKNLKYYKFNHHLFNYLNKKYMEILKLYVTCNMVTNKEIYELVKNNKYLYDILASLSKYLFVKKAGVVYPIFLYLFKVKENYIAAKELYSKSLFFSQLFKESYIESIVEKKLLGLIQEICANECELCISYKIERENYLLQKTDLEKFYAEYNLYFNNKFIEIPLDIFYVVNINKIGKLIFLKMLGATKRELVKEIINKIKEYEKKINVKII